MHFVGKLPSAAGMTVPGRVVLLRASPMLEVLVSPLKSATEMEPVASSLTWEANCAAWHGCQNLAVHLTRQCIV